MASLQVLAFDHEGRPVQFDTWLEDLQLYLLSDSKDNVSLFDLASGAAIAPPATTDCLTRSQWLTRDAAACLAIRNHLPLAECAHFGQHRTAQALYDAVVARYSSPATAALGRLLLPYLFPELSAFTTVEDLVSHLRASDARYRAAVPAEFLDWNPPPMYITLYFIVTRLPDSLCSVRDHFLSLDPTSLTVDLLEQNLLAAETSAVAVGTARGTPHPPFFEGAKRRSSKGKGGRGGGGGSGGSGGGSGSGGGGSSGGGGGGATVGGSGGSGGGGGGSDGSGGSGGGGTGSGGTGARRVGSGGGHRQQQQQRRSEILSPQQLREWFLRGASGGSCPYVIRTGDRAGQTCGRLHTQHRCFSHLDNAWRAEFGDDVELPRWADLLKSRIAIFDLDFDAILSAICVDFSTNLVSGADLQDQGVDQFTPASQRVTHCTCARTGRHLATFTRRPGSSLYTLSTESPPVPPSGQVAASSQVLATTSGPGPESAPCSCRLLSHQTLLWHHRLGHPSLARLRGMASRVLVSGLPRSLPPLPLGPTPTCVPCVEGRQRAAPHSSAFPPTEAPLQTLHRDVWGPARVRGQGHERYFLLVVDDYSRYTTVFPLRSKGDVTEVLIDWIRAARLQLRESFGSDFPVLRLHSDRGGEFSSARLGAFCRARGIRQTFTLPASPQQNGIAERRIGMVMDVARTSMIHAAAPHFLWPFAVRYAAHQLNLQPQVSLPETSPTLLWTGKVGDASAFRYAAHQLNLGFLGFPPDAPGWQFYHPTSRRVLSSQYVTFNESVPYYRLFPYRTAPLPPPPLFLVPGPPPVDPLPPQGPAPSGVSQVDAVEPVEVAVDSGAGSGGAEPWGAGSGGAAPGGAESGGAEPGDAESEGAEPGSAEPGGEEPGVMGLLVRAAGAGGTPGAAGTGGTPGAAGVGPAGASRAAGAGAAWGVGAGVGPAGGTTGAAGGTRAAGPAGVGAARASGATSAGAAGGVRVGGSPDAGPSAGAGVGAIGAGGAAGAGAAAGGTGAVPAGSGDPARLQPYFVPLLEQVLGLPPSSGPAPSLEGPQPVQSRSLSQPVQSQSLLQPVSPLPAPSPYTGPTGSLAERREPASRPASPVRTTRASRRAPRPRPPTVPGTHQMTLRPSTASQCVPFVKKQEWMN
ncbi:unnamed protein product [Closterium sp. NIES-53]